MIPYYILFKLISLNRMAKPETKNKNHVQMRVVAETRTERKVVSHQYRYSMRFIRKIAL